MMVNQPYKRYSQIDSEAASYICLVAGVTYIEDVPLMEINSFMTDMEDWYKDA